MDLGPFRLSTSDREELIRYIKRGETSSRMSDYSVCIGLWGKENGEVFLPIVLFVSLFFSLVSG